MTDISHASPWAGALAVVCSLLVGAYAVGVLDALWARVAAGRALGLSEAVASPWRRGSLLLLQQGVSTERPDSPAWVLAPALYAGFAAAAATVIPLSESWVVADVRAGIVLWGSAEALAMVAVYLHGWSPNAPFPLLGGYRFVAQALSYELLSMFVLIAVALPAGSLQLSEIVRSQAGLWNVVRHPPGLPLWLVVTSSSPPTASVRLT